MYFAYRRTSLSGHPRETSNAPGLAVDRTAAGLRAKDLGSPSRADLRFLLRRGGGTGDSAGPKAIRKLAVRPEIVAKTVPSRVARIARSTSLYVLLGALGIAAARSSVGQDNLRALPAEADKDCIGITRQQADAILKELTRIRQILEKQGRSGLAEQMPMLPQTRRLSLKGGVSLGSGQAPIAIVEFADFECPYCRQFQSTVFAEIRRRYIDTGKVRFVIRDFPLSTHANAMQAAEAARCAGDQGKYWPMHDALFSEPPKLDQIGLAEHAESLALDVDMFRSCLARGKHKPDIETDMQVAGALEINGTPSFLIGKITGEEVEGSIIVGSQRLSAFDAKLKEMGETLP
jgi:protein-disulfide isomerase